MVNNYFITNINRIDSLFWYAGVYTLEGKHMKKTKPEALFQRLVNNKISREEFEELLQGLEDQEVKAQLEERMKQYFDEIMRQYEKENKRKKVLKTTIPSNKNNE